MLEPSLVVHVSIFEGWVVVTHVRLKLLRLPRVFPFFDDIQKFLDVLDESLETFMTMSPHDKYNLYASLVSFTHTSLGIFMKGEKV